MKKQTWILNGLSVAAALGFMAFRPQHAPLETVPFVDLEKYTGTWYEIAAFPQRFQQGCHCTKAIYELNAAGYLEVHNSCKKNGPNGEEKAVTGKAWVVEKETNAKLKVRFFWPFKGDYWVLALAKDYSYAVVGTPDRESLWILCRQPKMAQQVYDDLKTRMKPKGFDVSRLEFTDQQCR